MNDCLLGYQQQNPAYSLPLYYYPKILTEGRFI
jgi:hypothetical protein